MSFFRPEAVAILSRWKGVIIAFSALLASVMLLVRSAANGNTVMIGIATIASIGFAMTAIILVQRVRFMSSERSFGVVEVDEREIRFFRAGGRAILSLETIDRIEISNGRYSGPTWVLHRNVTGLGPVVVPLTTIGAEQLFDAFAALPGISLSRLIEKSREPPAAIQTVWERDDDRHRRPIDESSDPERMP